MMAKQDSVFGDQAASVELLWGPAAGPGRGSRPALSLERIAQAAIKIADADGLPAVSMQRVASELEYTKMALYRYVPGKAELLALMIDMAIDEPPALDAQPGGWRPKLEAWARYLWTKFQRHPWLLAATVGRRVMGPNELGWVECAVGALDGTGLHGGELLDAVLIISGHVRNVAQQTVTAVGVGPGITEQQMGAAIAKLLHTYGDRYPALKAAVRSAASGSSQDQGLNFGLGRILDGLEMLITHRSTYKA
jgi:AcrR family transcriptional regulator